MNFTNGIYLILWVFVYYGCLLMFLPYMYNLLQNLPAIGVYWSSIPADTQFLINILLYIIVPLVAVAYTIKSSSPENQIVVQQ